MPPPPPPTAAGSAQTQTQTQKQASPAPAGTTAQPPQPSATTTTPAKQETATAKKKSKHKKVRSANNTGDSAQPAKTVVAQGGGTAQEGNLQISAAMPHDQALDHERTTEQLLQATEANLKSINRPLTADEQAMVSQVRSYVDQARRAATDGDLERAHNLALKAHLLSDALLKH